jgi:hypothetical protein
MPPSKNSRASSRTNHSLIRQAHRIEAHQKVQPSRSERQAFRVLTPYCCAPQVSRDLRTESPAAAPRWRFSTLDSLHFAFLCALERKAVVIPRAHGGHDDFDAKIHSARWGRLRRVVVVVVGPRFRPLLAGKWGQRLGPRESWSAASGRIGSVGPADPHPGPDQRAGPLAGFQVTPADRWAHNDLHAGPGGVVLGQPLLNASAHHLALPPHQASPRIRRRRAGKHGGRKKSTNYLQRQRLLARRKTPDLAGVGGAHAPLSFGVAVVERPRV